VTFFDEALPEASRAAAATGLFTSVVLAQWADETDYGQSTDWTVKHNPGNISPGGVVASYPSLVIGVQAYIYTMNSQPQFGPSIRKGTTPQAQCFLLGDCSPVWAASHYGSPPGSTLVQIIEDSDLTRYDTAPPIEEDDVKAGIVNVGPGQPTWLVFPQGKVQIPSVADIEAWRTLGALDVTMTANQVALLPTL
jgi:hypothetical protein